jgi:hypothetical protein
MGEDPLSIIEMERIKLTGCGHPDPMVPDYQGGNDIAINLFSGSGYYQP